MANIKKVLFDTVATLYSNNWKEGHILSERRRLPPEDVTRMSDY